MGAGAGLRKLLGENRLLVVPGVYDALSARVLQRAGFPALYLSGYGVSAALLGLPDAGLVTMSEMSLVARYVTGAVAVPVIADADTGFGNVVNVRRTVGEYVAAGVAGIQLEDQVNPKRCGHVAGKQVVSLKEAAGKIRAAVETREEMGSDCVIIARTDARGVAGGDLEAAIQRGLAFAEAGADIVFLEALTSADEVEQAVGSIPAPVLYNVAGVSPRLPLERLAELGVAVALFPTLSLLAGIRGVWDSARELRDHGSRAYDEALAGLAAGGFGPVDAFLGFPEVRALEERFLPPDDLSKYAGSVGYQP